MDAKQVPGNGEWAAERSEVLRAGRLEIRPHEFAVLAEGRPLPLTMRELQLLTALARRSERIVAREELYRVVWQQPFHKRDRSVDVYVAKLRVKLERELPGWRFIHTHFGFGYRFSPEQLQILHNHATGR